MTQSEKIEDVSIAIEFIDHTVISNPESKFGAPRQAPMRVIAESGANAIDFFLDPFAHMWREV